MTYYPILLQLVDQPCVVVGGGEVATRKVEGLLGCSARVRVVSPIVTPRLRHWIEEGTVDWIDRPYYSESLQGARLVIGATDDQAVNLRVFEDCKALGIWCNIADRPECCDFILPSVIRRGDLIVAVSTSGKSPAFAKTLRKQLEGLFGQEYAVFLQLMGRIRKRLLAEDHAPEAHKHLFETLIAGGLLEAIRLSDEPRIDALLERTLGHGFRFQELMEDKMSTVQQQAEGEEDPCTRC
ncbi:MAG: bifunctional precorrin-2 dehydrogenase/sirohydrochlorin ferrochelatase [Thermodesulfobacteriota bacterium]